MKAVITPFIVLLTIYQTCAQSIDHSDTLGFARSLAYQKHFEQADELLTSYNSHHTDINALQLQAQVLYWMKSFNRSSTVYENAINRFPDVTSLKLDYGRMLFELNQWHKAKGLLTDVIAHDNVNPEANKLLAYIDLWTGNIHAARQRVKSILQHHSDNPDAISILNQIKNYTAPYVLLNMDLESDDQPRTGNSYGIETGVYRSRWWAPVVQAQLNRFTVSDSSYRSLWLQAGNKISLSTKTTFSVGAGVFQHLLNSGGAYFTGRLGITQKIGTYFSAEAGYEKKPYQYSIASIKKPVFEQDAVLALNLNKNDSWLGKAGYQQQHFNDNNTIHTVYAWLLFPVVNRTAFKLKAGYAFSFANADNNNYVPAKSLNEVAGSASVHSTVQGVYDPYFTQQNQFINALLASMNISFSKQVAFSARVSVGVYAQADNPSLVLERDRSNQTYISKTYNTITYTPVEWVNTLQVKLSQAFSIQALYNYSKLLFYTKNQGALQLKYNFINGSKN
jgi:tetratricopeptide (TPR) repeat protein